jgi:hypothetical protein
MGIPLLCVAHSDSSVDSATEPASAQRLHPTAELWRVLCCTATSAEARSAANASANKSSHNNHGVNTQSYLNSEPQKNSRCILVTDACDLPKHKLIVRQLAALDNAPVVVCVDSTIAYSKGAAQVRCKSAQFSILRCFVCVTQLNTDCLIAVVLQDMRALAAVSASGAAARIQARLSSVPNTKVVDIRRYEASMRAALDPMWEHLQSVLCAQYPGGDTCSACDSVTLWSTQGADALLQWCHEAPGPLPTEVANLLLCFAGLGLLPPSALEDRHADCSSIAGSNTAGVNNLPTRSTEDGDRSSCFQQARAVVREHRTLLERWQARLDTVTAVPQQSAVSCTANWATQWLDALNTDTVNLMRRVDEVLVQTQTAGKARQALASLRDGTTVYDDVNSTQYGFVTEGIVPLQRPMRRWLCAYIVLLQSAEAALRATYVELATHSLCAIDEGLFPIVQFLSAVNDVVREIGERLGSESMQWSAEGVVAVVNAVMEEMRPQILV